jgi:methyl-accepting chemotaxis protein
MKSSKRACSLKARLLTAPVVVLLIVFVTSGFLISNRVNRALVANEEAQIKHMSEVLLEIYNNQVKSMTDVMKMSVLHKSLYDWYIKAQRGDSSLLKDFLEQMILLSDVDDIHVVQNTGKVVLHLDSNTGADDLEFKSIIEPIVRYAPLKDRKAQLDEMILTQLIQENGTFKLVSVGPILDRKNNVKAALVFVKRVDSAFLARQKSHFGDNIEVSVASADRIAFSTLSGLSLPTRLINGENNFNSEVNGKPFWHRFVPVDNGKMFLGLSYDLSENVATRASIHNIMIVIFLVAVGLVLGIIVLNVRGTVRSVDTLVGYAERIAEGDLSSEIEELGSDEMNRLAGAMNKMASKIKAIVNDINMLTENAVAGNLETRADTSKHGGDFGKIVDGVNKTLDAVVMPLSMAAEYVHQISKGVIPPKIEHEYSGDFNDIKNHLNSLIDAMNEVTHLAEEIAGGNLMVDVKERSSRDKLMHALSLMVQRLKNVVVKLQTASSQVAAGSRELSYSSEQMSQGATEQALQTEQVASAMSEMSHAVIDVAKNAMEASVAASETNEFANKGLEIVRETVMGMHEVAETVKSSAVIIEELGRSSRQIGNIINTINDIADQTNLLALNAAIEAARAGEKGRGFAVVADEVRKLAERTGKATKDIADMIKKIQADTEQAVKSMESAKAEVEKGVKLSEDARGSLNQIVSASKRGMDMVQRIATTTEEQSASTAQVSANIEAIAKITKDIESSSGKIKDEAQKLAQMAVALKEDADWFKLEKTDKQQEAVHDQPSSETPVG